MSLLKPTELAPAENLRRLLFLRWFEIVGQILIISGAFLFLDLAIPLLPVTLILLLLTIVNILSKYLLNKPQRITDSTFLFQLLMDVAGLTAILYFTGGATNAFAWVLLVPHAIASTLLPKPYSWLMAIVTSAAYTLLIFLFKPLLHKGSVMEMLSGEHFQQHLIGMWMGFVMVTFLMAHFVSGMANTVRLRDKLLANMREEALRDERLIALATLATSAAHELGTPLGTMDIIAHELDISLGKDKNTVAQKQLKTIQQQIKRCKKVLLSITDNVNKAELAEGQAILIDDYIDNIVKQWRVSHLDVNLQLSYQTTSAAPTIISNTLFSHALINVLDNAVQASPLFVSLCCEWDKKNLMLTVLDDGPGIDESRLMDLGESWQTSKQSGLGIGLYLAKTSIERLGGNILWDNRKEGGLSVSIQIPLNT